MARPASKTIDVLFHHPAGKVPPRIQLWAKSFRQIKHDLRTNYDLPPSKHIGYELVCVDYGKLHVTLQDQSLELGVAEGIIIPPQTLHSYQGPQQGSVQTLNIIFYGSCPAKLLKKKLFMEPEHRRIMRVICDELSKPSEYAQQLAITKLNELLIHLARRGEETSRSAHVAGDNYLNHRTQIVETALEYLNRHLDRRLNISQLARIVGVSTSHLRGLVRGETGQSLQQHLIAMRMTEAKRLLHESPESVKEVAYSVGYHSIAHFCNLFKTQTGMTPTEYARTFGLGKRI